MYYIGTYEDCIAYDNTVTEGEEYPIIGDNWAIPFKHPTENKYSIIKHDEYESNMRVAEELTKDWYEKES